jgi:hypothetical protein
MQGARCAAGTKINFSRRVLPLIGFVLPCYLNSLTKKRCSAAAKVFYHPFIPSSTQAWGHGRYQALIRNPENSSSGLGWGFHG